MFSFAEDLSDGEEVFPKEIAKWNSNDLMDKIEAADTEETPGMTRRPCAGTALSTACVLSVCVCVFSGELFKEMTVDYESAAIEERLDEVRVCDAGRACTKHGPDILF